MGDQRGPYHLHPRVVSCGSSIPLAFWKLPRSSFKCKEHGVSSIPHPPVSQGPAAQTGNNPENPASSGCARPSAPRTSKTQEQSLRGRMQGNRLELHHCLQEPPECALPAAGLGPIGIVYSLDSSWRPARTHQQESNPQQLPAHRGQT